MTVIFQRVIAHIAALEHLRDTARTHLLADAQHAFEWGRWKRVT